MIQEPPNKALQQTFDTGAAEAELTARPEGKPSPIPDAHGMV